MKMGVKTNRTSFVGGYQRNSDKKFDFKSKCHFNALYIPVSKRWVFKEHTYDTVRMTQVTFVDWCHGRRIYEEHIKLSKNMRVNGYRFILFIDLPLFHILSFLFLYSIAQKNSPTTWYNSTGWKYWTLSTVGGPKRIDGGLFKVS